MTGHVVHQPQPQHHCNPPDQDTTRTLTFEGFHGPVEVHPWMPNGTVWECDCGQRWRASYPYVNVFAPTWTKVRTPSPKQRRSLLARLGLRGRRSRGTPLATPTPVATHGPSTTGRIDLPATPIPPELPPDE